MTRTPVKTPGRERAPIEAERPPALADDPLARDLRGFGPVGLLGALLVIAGDFLVHPLSAILAIAWARRSGTPLRALGYVPAPRWPRTLVLGILVGVALRFVLKAIVLPLLHADPINHAYHDLVGHPAALPGALFTVIVGAGFGEEALFRGFLFERLGRLLGRGAVARTGIVLITSILFGLAHVSNQGLAGAGQGLVTGLALGTLYAVTGSIWLPMIVHASFDVTALATIYWGLELRVAHLIFR